MLAYPLVSVDLCFVWHIFSNYIPLAAGIPDFRSEVTGLFNNLQKYKLPTPEAIFMIQFFMVCFVLFMYIFLIGFFLEIEKSKAILPIIA